MRSTALLCAFWLGVVSLAACDDGGGSEGDSDGGVDAAPPLPPRPVTHPMDDSLRLDHLQTKGTHNSYHVETTDGVQEWHYTHAPLDVQLDEQGVRKVELDVHWDVTLDAHRVYHVAIVDEGTTCDPFVECLQVIGGWSDYHPGHHPIFVMIEPKDQDGLEPAEVASNMERLEEEILSVLPEERLITPDMVRGSRATLVEAIDQDGWPTLGEVRGRVLFFLDCNREVCVEYANAGTGLSGRLIFADSEPGDSWEAVRVMNDPVASQAEIQAAVADGRIVRTFADGIVGALSGDTNLDAALSSGAHLLSSDVPAPRDDTSYVMEIPGGMPSRCNPISAPAECTSTDIEDPALLEGP